MELLAGGFLVIVGWALGRRSRRGPKPAEPIRPICGCRHHNALHDPTTGECHGTVTVETKWAVRRGEWRDDTYPVAWDEKPCTCRKYVGPVPIMDAWVPEALDPPEEATGG